MPYKDIEKSKEHYRQHYRNLWKNDPEKMKARYRKYRYGITQEQFEMMQKAQEGKCKICREKAATHVDHCHKTGKVRGLLCQTCNTALGGFKDSPLLLQSAIHYLNEQ